MSEKEKNNEQTTTVVDNTEPVVEKKKRKISIPLIISLVLLILVLLGLGIYRLYDKLNKTEPKELTNPITITQQVYPSTTTTTVVNNSNNEEPSYIDTSLIKNENLKKFAIASIKLGNDLYGMTNYGIVLNDKSLRKLDTFYLLGECKEEGKTVTVNNDYLNYSYTCKKQSSTDDYTGVVYDINVNNKFNVKVGESTCGKPLFYFGDDIYVFFQTSCAINSATLSVHDASGKELYKHDGIAYPLAGQLYDSDENIYYSFLHSMDFAFFVNPYVENNKLFFIEGDDSKHDDDYPGKDKCFVREYDLKNKSIKTIDTFNCNFQTGN